MAAFPLAALAGLLFLSGCAVPKQARSRIRPPPIVWPAPPEEPRIAYMQSIYRPEDTGARLPVTTRFANWLTGSHKGNEPLVKPFGLALDEEENLCLTDTGLNTVCFWDRQNSTWSRWAEVGPIRFLAPVAVAKRNGLFYVADPGLGGVVVFDRRGQLQQFITNNLERPAGLAAAGRKLFVADSARHCIVCFDLEGRYLSEFGRRGSGPGEFNFPTHIAADRSGSVVVTDALNGRVQRFNSEGAFQVQIGSMGDGPGCFSRPKGIALDASGNIYVVDALFDNIQIFNQQARFLLNWGEAGNELGQFWLPNGIVISSRNEIFVADSYNRRVQVFSYVGTQ